MEDGSQSEKLQSETLPGLCSLQLTEGPLSNPGLIFTDTSSTLQNQGRAACTSALAELCIHKYEILLRTRTPFKLSLNAPFPAFPGKIPAVDFHIWGELDDTAGTSCSPNPQALLTPFLLSYKPGLVFLFPSHKEAN